MCKLNTQMKLQFQLEPGKFYSLNYHVPIYLQEARIQSSSPLLDSTFYKNRCYNKQPIIHKMVVWKTKKLTGARPYLRFLGISPSVGYQEPSRGLDVIIKVIESDIQRLF